MGDFNQNLLHHLADGGDPWAALPGGELNFPPDHPKMPGEPPRVQPSKKVAAHWDEQGNRIAE